MISLSGHGCSSRYAWRQTEIALLDGGLRDQALPIVKWDGRRPAQGGVLRQRAQPVREFDATLRRLLARMRATLEAASGVGLAAPQVGISRRVILVETRPPAEGKPGRVEALVNPVVRTRSEGTDDDYEACLSVDGVGALVRRALRMRVAYHSPGGEERELEVEGWVARIVQHEMDHLGGVLFVDRAMGKLLPLEEARARRKHQRKPAAASTGEESEPTKRGPARAARAR